MSVPGPLARVLTWTGLGCAGLLAVTGALALRGSGLVAVGVGGLLAGCSAAGLAREAAEPSHRRTGEAAVQAAAWTVCGLLILAGIATVAGGVVAALVVVGVLVAVLVRFVRSGRLAAVNGHPFAAQQSPPTPLRPVPPRDAAEAPTRLPDHGTARQLLPVADLPTRELGREWTRTTQALALRLDPVVRAALVQRREETLDELERRDADGFTRWLGAGPAADSDPADYVRGGPRRDGTEQTDAA